MNGLKHNLINYIFVVLIFSSCSSKPIEEQEYKALNEFKLVRIRKQYMDAEKKELLYELPDTFDFRDVPLYKSVLFDAKCASGKYLRNDGGRAKFEEDFLKVASDKLAKQKRWLDSLVAYRDTVLFAVRFNKQAFDKAQYTVEDSVSGWPYITTDVEYNQKMLFLTDLHSKKVHDTVTFECYYANYWKGLKKDLETRNLKKVNPSDIGPRVRCSGRTRIPNYGRGGDRYTSCSAYTSSRSGRCGFH